jgi:hypothetical protein
MASTIKVNNIQNQCGANIANKCGSTITLGASGDTITLACGASQTGFGRTGTVDWNTTAITADPANAVSGTGYFANTTSAAFTITLPTSPSAGDIVAVRDYAQTFATNNLTIGRNSSNIDGSAADLSLNTNGQAITLVYVDGTQGWKSVNSNEIVGGPRFLTATGGTIVCCGDYRTHIFTGPGNFQVTCAGNPLGSNTVDYLVIAGGGGTAVNGGGGGAGGFRTANSYGLPAPTTSPLATPTALPVSAQVYPITVGAGGTGAGPYPCTGNTPGSPSIFSTIVSAGGGRAADQCVTSNGDPGGSGGGGRGPGGTAGAGNTPPVSPPQGQPGGPGDGTNVWASGGGAGGAGISCAPQVGGIGSYISDTFIGPTAPSYGTPGPVGSTRYFAGGGGGANQGPTSGSTHAGGAGGGGTGAAVDTTNNTAGTTNTGGGGGAGNGGSGAGAAGGSGIVIIRYKYQ